MRVTAPRDEIGHGHALGDWRHLGQMGKPTGNFPRRKIRDRPAVEHDGAGPRLEQARKTAKQGRFARSICTHDSGERSLRDLHIKGFYDGRSSVTERGIASRKTRRRKT